jgi:DNA polymerase-3 subunit delta
MSENTPTVYILHGDDEFAIQELINHKLKPLMGESSNAEMNITTLDGVEISLTELESETHAIPFLTERRMVILSNPLSLGKSAKDREDFLALLEDIPESTACILKVDELLDEKHWLRQWSQDHPALTWQKPFTLPQGQNMTRWIQNRAQDQGGAFTREAARLLAIYINEDPRLASQEIEKLLTYVNFEREVTEDDVRKLTADVRQGDVFEMVDAISRGDGETAMRMLRRQLQEKSPLPLFGMIVRQFRLLIQVKEILDQDPTRDKYSIARELDEHPYPIQKIIPQTKRFSLPQLEKIYHQLSDVDAAMKSGKLDQELALDMLIAALTA